MRIDDQLAARFKCARCQRSGGHASRIATTGTGISRLLDFQHRHFIAISCHYCGYSELYNPRMLQEKDTLGNVLDIIFGN